jgi:hypothetical protein
MRTPLQGLPDPTRMVGIVQHWIRHSEPQLRPLVVLSTQNRSGTMLGTIIIIILVLALIGALPTWGHSRNWGYAPSGGLGLIVVILIILLLLGRL